MRLQNKHKLPLNPSLLLLLSFSLLSLLSAFVPASWADPVLFVRGDANGDGHVDLSDAISTLNYLYLGGTKPACLDSADSNDDGKINTADVVSIINTLFLGKNQMAPFYPGAFYDWTTDDPNVCGDIPDWLKEQLGENPKNQPAPDPNQNPFAVPGIWQNQPPANPIMHAVAMIHLMSPADWETLRITNPTLYKILVDIYQLDFDSILDYQTLLSLLQQLEGWDVSAFISAGLPLYVANSLADAIVAADTASPADVQTAAQNENKSAADSLSGLSPGLHEIDSGPDVNPDDPMFCYICGSGCSTAGADDTGGAGDGGTGNTGGADGGGGAAADNSDNCGMKVAYDIYFSPASKPGATAVTFIQQLVNEVKKAQESCCKHYVYVRIPDTGSSVSANAKTAADALKEEFNKIAGKAANGDQCIRKIIINIYCFSASCIEAIHFAQDMEPCDIPCPECKCCGESYDKIKKSINIVSMEGIFDAAPGIGGGVANLCAGGAGWVMGLVGIPGAYACSAFSESYGGAEPPCVCSFNAYSRDPGAGSTDPNLKDWKISSHQIDAKDHADVPKAMTGSANWNDIKPECACKDNPAP